VALAQRSGQVDAIGDLLGRIARLVQGVSKTLLGLRELAGFK
jgi:hypothetical protein